MARRAGRRVSAAAAAVEREHGDAVHHRPDVKRERQRILAPDAPGGCSATIASTSTWNASVLSAPSACRAPSRRRRTSRVVRRMRREVHVGDTHVVEAGAPPCPNLCSAVRSI
jgi:hypothetical protein